MSPLLALLFLKTEDPLDRFVGEWRSGAVRSVNRRIADGGLLEFRFQLPAKGKEQEENLLLLRLRGIDDGKPHAWWHTGNADYEFKVQETPDGFRLDGMLHYLFRLTLAADARNAYSLKLERLETIDELWVPEWTLHYVRRR